MDKNNLLLKKLGICNFLGFNVIFSMKSINTKFLSNYSMQKNSNLLSLF